MYDFEDRMKYIIKEKYDCEHVAYDREDTYVVILNGKMFHVDSNGMRLYKEEYDFVHSYVNGMCHVILNGKHFHIYKDGTTVYNEKYDDLESYNHKESGTYCVKLKNRWFHINTSGQRLYNQTYIEIKEYVNGIARVRKGKQWFHIDMKGTRLYKQNYTEIYNYNDNNLARVRLKDKWMLIDKQGNPPIPKLSFEEKKDKFGYEDVFFNCESGKATNKCNKKSFHINEKWNRLYKQEYDYVCHYYEGIAFVKEKGKWFQIDVKGERINYNEYDEVYPIVNGIYKVKLDGKMFHIDYKGERLYSQYYEWIDNFSDKGEAYVKKFWDDKFRYTINKQGRIIGQCIVDRLPNGINKVESSYKEFVDFLHRGKSLNQSRCLLDNLV